MLRTKHDPFILNLNLQNTTNSITFKVNFITVLENLESIKHYNFHGIQALEGIRQIWSLIEARSIYSRPELIRDKQFNHL